MVRVYLLQNKKKIIVCITQCLNWVSRTVPPCKFYFYDLSLSSSNKLGFRYYSLMINIFLPVIRAFVPKMQSVIKLQDYK